MPAQTEARVLLAVGLVLAAAGLALLILAIFKLYKNRDDFDSRFYRTLFGLLFLFLGVIFGLVGLTTPKTTGDAVRATQELTS